MSSLAVKKMTFSAHLTQKANLKHTRYGWLRLTPAYGVHLVDDLVSDLTADQFVLDPFCGTGTTALVCAEKGLPCATTDINPFLIWLAKAKTCEYSPTSRKEFLLAALRIEKKMTRASSEVWSPPLHQIEKWWDESTLATLGKGMAAIRNEYEESPVKDLLCLAFCRTMIERANVSFGHQSMSFKKPTTLNLFEENSSSFVVDHWRKAVTDIEHSAGSQIEQTPEITLCDARELSKVFKKNSFDRVITSPPYPNRMSYIRELRPYMYWLDYLTNGRDAGELDWKAIGGTWGCATSNLGKWKPEAGQEVPFAKFESICSKIGATSKVLGTYVEKYFHDMTLHCSELFKVVKPGGRIDYIVGNSKFYDVLLPVEEIYAALFEHSGFTDVKINTLRKRSSKKELFEYDVIATKPK
jgi:hypothetical protein